MSTTTQTQTTSPNLFTDAAGKVRVRGSNRQSPRARFTGRNIRALRRAQHLFFAIHRRDMTSDERGALNSLSNRATRD